MFVPDPNNPNVSYCFHQYTRKCAVMLTKNDQNDVTVFPGTGKYRDGHEDPPSPFLIDRLQMSKDIVTQAGISSASFQTIFEQIRSRNEAAGLYLDFSILYPPMVEERRRHLPAVPQSLDEFANVIEESPLYKKFFVRHVKSGEGTALLFSSNEMLQVLFGATRLVLEVLYSVAPRLPSTSEVLVIHVQQGDIFLGVLYCLLNEAISVDLYTQIMTFVASRTGNSQIMDVTTPYREPLVQAVKQVFDKARVIGSPFYVAQGMVDQYVDLGLLDLNDETSILDICLLSPYFPEAKFDELRRLLFHIGEEQSELHPQVRAFVEFAMSWMYHPSKMSFYCCDWSASAFSEMSLHDAFKNFGGNRPDTWTLLECIKSALLDNYDNYKRALQNLSPEKGRAPKSLTSKNGALIKQMDHFLSDNKSEMRAFIQSLSWVNKQLLQNLLREPRLLRSTFTFNGNVLEIMDDPIRISGSIPKYPQQVQKRGRGRPPARGSTPYKKTPSSRSRTSQSPYTGLSVGVPNNLTVRAVSVKTRQSTSAYPAGACTSLLHKLDASTGVQNSAANLPEDASLLRSTTPGDESPLTTVGNFLANLPEGVPSTSTLRTASNNPCLGINSGQIVDTVGQLIQKALQVIVPTLLKNPPKKEAPECTMCIMVPATHAFLPCGHLAACETCAGVYLSLEKMRCNICRLPYKVISEVKLD